MPVGTESVISPPLRRRRDRVEDRDEGGHEQRRDNDRPEDIDDVALANVAPALVVEAEQNEDDQGSDYRRGDRGLHQLHVARGDPALEAQPERQIERNGDEDGVGRHLRKVCRCSGRAAGRMRPRIGGL